jgi:uncharacterized membrane protein YidH (DUF202 family)
MERERTTLAWQRTSITALLVFVPLVLVSLRVHQAGLAAGGAFLALGSTVLVALSWRDRGRPGGDGLEPSPFAPMLRVAVVTGLGALGGALVGVAVFLA